MNKRVGESFFLVFVLLVGIAVFYGSWTVRIFTPEPITAKTYGCTISGLLIVCTIVQIIKDFKIISRKADTNKIVVSHPISLLIMLGASMFYCFGIANIGYYTCTFAFALLMIIVLAEKRDIKHIIGYAGGCLVFCVLLSVLFNLIQIYMPHTPLL